MPTTDTLAIYGQSGHGKVIRQIALASGYQKILWIDDAPDADAMTFETFLQTDPHIPVALGIGNNTARQKVYLKLKEKQCNIATLVHPSAIIAEDCSLGEGSVVMPLAVINAEAAVGIAAIINSHSCVEHEAQLGDFVHLSPQVALGGNVRIGDFTHIGIGSAIIQGISIGEHTTIAAGSSVIHNIPDHVMAAGVPATVRKELS